MIDVSSVFTILGAGMVGYAGCGISNVIKQAVDEYHNDKELVEIEQKRKEIEDIEISDWELVLGYEEFGRYRKPIITDMKKTPHMLVCGLSCQGKSKMVEYAIRGKNAVLFNTDSKDFRSIEAERINDFEEIQEILQKLVDTKQNDKAAYVVIDEILALIKSGYGKKIMDLLTQLLAVGSHKNIYIIAITQCAEKEVVNNKHLYNTRVCFKMLDDSAYKVVLGKTPEDIYIKNRDFYYVTNKLGKGYTYDI